jgi:retron-type reverse transcriptase
VILSIFVTVGVPQKHVRMFTPSLTSHKGIGLHYKPFRKNLHRFAAETTSIIFVFEVEWRKSGYRPLPVRRKEIDKPDGGVRLLGIPTVLDRLIEQATAQGLTAIGESTSSEYSFGFRPRRSQHEAIRQGKR